MMQIKNKNKWNKRKRKNNNKKLTKLNKILDLLIYKVNSILLLIKK